ncbi:MAG: hypothetical protein LBJ35_03815, partial [Spirochaetaceae bacterium]|nr:hypothetical protein [Spirochaetaceae bacterium]
MMERLNSLEEIAIKGKLSGIRKLLFRIKKDKIRLPHIANSLLLIAAERAFNKLKKHDFDFEKDLFIKKWLKTSNGKTYFDFNGALLPDMRNGPEKLDKFLRYTFEDTFLIDCYYADDYSKHIVDILDKLMSEGPYGYKDEASGFDVTVKAGDIVIDAGAWIGDFSAYAASKGAYVYAFEPVTGVYNILTETAELNQN